MKKIKLFAMALLSLVATGAMAGGVVDLNTSTATNNWYTEAGVGAVTNKNGSAFSDPDLTTCTPAGKKTGSSYFTIQVFNATKELIISAQSSSNRSLSSIATGSEVACGTALTKDDDYTISGGGESYIIPKNTCGNQFSIAFANPIPANDYVKITLSGNTDIVDVTFVDAADAPYPYVKSFKMGEIEAEVDTAAKTITAVLPFGTDRTEAISYADVVMGGTAKNYGISDDVLTAIDSVDQSKNILYDLSGIIVSTTQYFTVSYYDDTKLLGSEQVAKGSKPVDFTNYQTKAHCEFVNWLDSEGQVVNPGDSTITSAANFYGSWSMQVTQSSSINIEQLILDNGKGYKITDALTAANILYANIDGLDSLNDKKDYRNEPFLGLKIKKAGGYLEMGLKAGDSIKVKFGNVADSLKITINGVDSILTVADAAQPFFYIATEDCWVKIATTTKNTVVFKQIMINEQIKEVTLPESPATALMEMMMNASAEKFILDGKVYLRHGEKIFNAMGQEMKF